MGSPEEEEEEGGLHTGPDNLHRVFRRNSGDEREATVLSATSAATGGSLEAGSATFHNLHGYRVTICLRFFGDLFSGLQARR